MNNNKRIGTLLMIMKKITFCNFCLSATTAIMALAISITMAVAFEKLTVGQQAHIACKTVSVYSTPSVFSPITGSKTFGDVVKIIKLAAIFTLPESDYQSRKKLEQANARARKQGQTPKAITETDYTRPAWAKIGTKKYVPTSCLVGTALFKEQVIEIAEKKVAAVVTSKAKRNFSEDEDGDLRAMRGAAGKAIGGKANFVAIDQLISDAQGRINPATDRAFRQAGHLGEYK
jgi:hypothetical protein